ncbi:MAG: hypothetical protein QW220_02785 [Candidatus Bathyarchaeia archaeon]
MSVYLLLLLAASAWIIADGLLAFILVYPPTEIWSFVRFARILLGVILLLEARRVRTKFIIGGRDLEGLKKYGNAYVDLLDFIGVWILVDGIGTGFMGYVYPILIWQFIRLIRVFLGFGLALGSHILWLRIQKVLKAKKEVAAPKD